jgi:hypothetical protein
LPVIALAVTEKPAIQTPPAIANPFGRAMETAKPNTQAGRMLDDFALETGLLALNRLSDVCS